MRICTVDNCKRKYYAKGFCEGHYKRQRSGKPLKGGFRTTVRKARVVGEIALIPLGIDAKDGYAIVDKDFAYIDKYKWSLGKRGYAIASMNGYMRLLHHLILGKPDEGKVVDHINRDKLDNRKLNLRFVTQKVNTRNAGMLTTNTSGHKGVSFDKRRGKWFAQSSFNGKHQFGGYHDTIEEAIKARERLEHP